MAEKNYAGLSLEVNDEGYLLDHAQWSKEIAVEIAKEENIDLDEDHFAVLDFIREKYIAGESLTIRKVGKSGIVDIKGLYKLFPGGPLKKSSRIAGIPKPSSCV
ncbi:MAG: TusE/DsrC/DsvC family sulfur relay protein [Bacteroidetes bacterium]|jgi:tRNA 2-thiouridine synthesizing protein E|nr:TusE/DsrC/DsvC family sulfur relay protein [Bacteroidota bacterium]MBT6684776.1 TusE/DsrC/DsvC family sulfur relay protein [Bacteroidota bacterium]MBT7141810.1 TusE/DsrC/DsvC family sulfur relay protein [Bacteroidota bacterium]MBT7490759.1 TusE/DsrC/DsvC family sulfur relay protein [Bacteroidota bacterium]